MKPSLSRRSFLKLATSAGLAAIISHPLLALAETPSPVKYLVGGSPNGSWVALTIDDCFSCLQLQRLEKILCDNHIQVTFFPTGKALEYTAALDPCIWQRLVQQGNMLGYHGYAHEYASQQTLKMLVLDYDLWMDAVEKVLGCTPIVRFARPPYGDLSASFLDLCKEKNLLAVLWTNSWGYSTEVVLPVLQQTHPGDIILLHLRAVDLDNLELAIPILFAHRLHAVLLSAFDPQPGSLVHPIYLAI